MTATFIATVGLAVLVSIDIGNLFYTQRSLQRSADLAAMAAAQRLDLPNAAQQSVAQNGLTVDGTNVTLAVVPGVWDASAGTAPTYFTAQAAVDGNTNAAKVTITQKVPYFFMVGNRQLQATAIAKNTSILSFSLGSGLAAVNGGMLNQLLGALLGSPNPLSLSLVSYQGLANANITVGQLMAQLGVGTVQQLLSTQISVGQFYTDVLTVAGQQSLISAMPLGATVSGTTIALGDNSATGGTSGVLALLAGVGNDQAAVNAQLNALDLLTTAAQIANSKSAVNVAPVTLNLVGLGAVTLSLKIIEPPVIAIGPPGQFLSGPNAGQWRTQARTAQVRLGLDVNVNAAGLLAIDLPIGLQVAAAQAHAKSTSCVVPRSSSAATISAQPQPVSLCIAAGASTALNGPMNCAAASFAPLVDLGVLGSVTVKANVSPTANSNWGDETIAATQIGLNPQTDTNGNSPPRVATQSVFSSVLNSNLSQLQLNTTLPIVGTIPLGSAGQVLLAPVIALVGTTLDSVLTPLLEALGIQLGYADIKLLSLDCDAVELVY